MFADKSKKKFYFFIGTTAELIKLFPVISEFERRRIDFKIITSGQTTIDFTEVSQWIKKTKTDIALPGKANESSVLLFLYWAIKGLLASPVLLFKEFNKINKSKSWLVVHGDTVSSLLGAVLAKIFGIRLAHVESGLRSFNFLEPFPEELCRYFVSRMADAHFCPNDWSLRNLPKKDDVKINTFQNTLIESCWFSLEEKDLSLSSNIRSKYFVFITHRQEHVIFGKQRSRSMVNFVLKNFPKNLSCVFVTHATTSNFLKSVNFNFALWKKKKVKFLPRLRYGKFMGLLRDAEFIVTDGGSNQEESYYLGLPCLLLRKQTERIEGLGENVLLAGDNKRLIKSFLGNYKSYRRSSVHPETRPSKIIVDHLIKS